MAQRRSPAILVVLASALVAILVGIAHPAAAAELKVGERAPDFTLPSTTGAPISLSQFRGKKAVLLEFYGADFVPQ